MGAGKRGALSFTQGFEALRQLRHSALQHPGHGTPLPDPGQVPPPAPGQHRPLCPVRRADLRPRHRRSRSSRPPPHPLTISSGSSALNTRTTSPTAPSTSNFALVGLTATSPAGTSGLTPAQARANGRRCLTSHGFSRSPSATGYGAYRRLLPKLAEECAVLPARPPATLFDSLISWPLEGRRHGMVDQSGNDFLCSEEVAAYQRDGYLLRPNYVSVSVISELMDEASRIQSTSGPQRIFERGGRTVRSVYGRVFWMKL